MRHTLRQHSRRLRRVRRAGALGHHLPAPPTGHTQTRTRTQTRARTHTQIQTGTRTQTRGQTQTGYRQDTDTDADTYGNIRKQTYRNTDGHAIMNTDTHTHTHTYSCSCNCVVIIPAGQAAYGLACWNSRVCMLHGGTKFLDRAVQPSKTP